MIDPTENAMPNSLEVLQAEVLQLPKSDRSKLLDRLIESLDADTAIEAAWDAVAEQRAQEIDSSAVKAVPFEEVLAGLKTRYPG